MKTGLFIQPINEPILKKIMEEHKFTKISPAINFVLQEYSKMINSEKVTVQKEVKAEQSQVVAKNAITEKKSNYNDWFIVEEKKQ